MTSELFRKLDAHLSQSDFDSQEWADGNGYELSIELLRKLRVDDWEHISQVWIREKRLWRACLVRSLSPSFGNEAACLLISALDDPDEEVAFLALNNLSFYCGINVDSNGPFKDGNILNLPFIDRVIGTDNIIEKIESISTGCAPFLQDKFKLLVDLLSSYSRPTDSSEV